MTEKASFPIFPGGTALTRLAVYDWEGEGGPPGGTPHMHTASTEAYLVVNGAGQVETLSMKGFAVHDLAVGDLLWFSPGTIHRLINTQGLDLLVVMQNAGLPESGDAIMTFPSEILADPSRYASAARLEGAAPKDLRTAVEERRRAAIVGFETLKLAALRDDYGPLTQFQRQAVNIIKGRVPQWRQTWEQTVAEQASATDLWLSSLEQGEFTHFQDAATARGRPSGPERVFGMCGLLQTWSGVEDAVQ